MTVGGFKKKNLTVGIYEKKTKNNNELIKKFVLKLKEIFESNLPIYFYD